MSTLCIKDVLPAIYLFSSIMLSVMPWLRLPQNLIFPSREHCHLERPYWLRSKSLKIFRYLSSILSSPTRRSTSVLHRGFLSSRAVAHSKCSSDPESDWPSLLFEKSLASVSRPSCRCSTSSTNTLLRLPTYLRIEWNWPNAASDLAVGDIQEMDNRLAWSIEHPLFS